MWVVVYITEARFEMILEAKCAALRLIVEAIEGVIEEQQESPVFEDDKMQAAVRQRLMTSLYSQKRMLRSYEFERIYEETE